ncbi:MAG: hypothetical protein JXR07_18925 [Reichenbachiella sp.]
MILFIQNVYAQPTFTDGSKLGLFIRSEFGSIDDEALLDFKNEYNFLTEGFKQKRTQLKSDELFLKRVFYKTHRKFLGEYEQGASFHEMIGKRKVYDCVTGTALYALILEDLNIEYEIRETDYHVYLMVKMGDRSYLMESTDPLNGFAVNSKEIEMRRNYVINDARSINEKLSLSGVASNEETRQNVNVIDNAVSLQQLAGLQYYNQALRQFNKEDFRKAFQYIIIAQGIYPSTRIKHASSYMFSVAFGD